MGLKEIAYIALMTFALASGYRFGWAGDSWVKWISVPIVSFILGASIRMMWGKP